MAGPAGLAGRPRPLPPAAPYVVAGQGRAGLAAARALAALTGPAEVAVWDGRGGSGERARGAELRELGIRCVYERSGASALDGFEHAVTVVKSPGLSFKTPLIVEAQRRGLTVIDEAELGWRLDHRPVVAVTGTNGKSTTASLMVGILASQGWTPLLAGNTTFGTPYCATSALAGDLIVAELSSFQLEGCPDLLPDAAILTNLTNDHLYRHGTRERYAACKRRAFIRPAAAVPVAAIGIDEPEGRRWADELRDRGSVVVTFGLHPSADRRLVATESTETGSTVTVTEGDQRRTLRTPLVGQHNALNLIGALALADGLDIAPGPAAAAIAGVGPLPGRFERVEGPGDISVVVDFAHNPDGISQALRAARDRQRSERGQVRVVLSTLSLVGEQQAYEMSRAAAGLADHLVLTTQRVGVEESADRLPAGLLEGAQSVRGAAVPEVILDRGAAITQAVRAAAPGDLVLILDRGDRSSELLRPDGTTIAFDDRVHAQATLAARAAERSARRR